MYKEIDYQTYLLIFVLGLVLISSNSDVGFLFFILGLAGMVWAKKTKADTAG